MTLVDTAVWIETFRSTKPLELEAVVAFDEIVTCLPVVRRSSKGFVMRAPFGSHATA
jgi:predicted nucleic acid-binding protein